MTAEPLADPVPAAREASGRPELISREPDAFAPVPLGLIFPVPAEGVVRAAAEVRGVAAVPLSRGVARVEPSRPHDAGVVLPPRVVRAVAAVPGALSVPRPPAAGRPLPGAGPERPPNGERRAFAIVARADVEGMRPGARGAAGTGVEGRRAGERVVARAAIEGRRWGEPGGAEAERERAVPDHDSVEPGPAGRSAAAVPVESRGPGERGSAGPQRSGGVGLDRGSSGAAVRGVLVSEAGAGEGLGWPVRLPVPVREPERAEIGRRGGAAGTGGDEADPVPKRRLRQTALPVVAAGVAAFAVATGYLAVSDRGSVSDLGRWGAHTVAEPVTVAGRGAGDPFGAATTVPVGAPARLRVGAIGLDTSLEELHLGPGGALVPPRGYGEAGWYAGGTAPGDVGPAVIAGHVDSKSGPAVFYRLREIIVGDRIEVVRGGQVVRFTVTRTAWYPKVKFPTGDVYGPTPDRQLRLITCGGVFDHGLRSYRDNLVVYAVAG